MLSGPVDAQNTQEWERRNVLKQQNNLQMNTDCKTYLEVGDCVFNGVQKIKIVNKIRRSLWFKVKSEKDIIG